MNIDWSKFSDKVDTTVTCQCTNRYRSHAKTVKIDGKWKGVSQKPCPNCGHNDRVMKISTDPEIITLTRSDVRELK